MTSSMEANMRGGMSSGVGPASWADANTRSWSIQSKRPETVGGLHRWRYDRGVCTLAVFARALPGWPLVVAANRDELRARPATAPGLLRTDAPRALGGRDLVAGGTWLGVNEDGLVVGLLNRRTTTPNDPTRRSRGLLCLDLLACRSAHAAAGLVARIEGAHYNPFNLLLADPRDAWVAVQGPAGAPQVERLDAGLHVLTNLDVDDPTCPRIATSHRRFAATGDRFARCGDVDALVGDLRAVLADHDTALDPRGPGALCVHAEVYGTRSSSVIAVGADGGVLYFHADGPPCQTPLALVPVPFA
jgi:uncharacterized protein with NRDE domain